MSHIERNFGQYLSEIMELGDFKTQTEAAKFIDITPQYFNMILNGGRKNPNWDVGDKIIQAHIKLDQRLV